jgi:hypothetical protein
MRLSRLIAVVLVAGPVLAAAPGERPGDSAMSCADIGAELQPAAQQMMAGMGNPSAAYAPWEQRAKDAQKEAALRSAIALACLPANIAMGMATGRTDCTTASDKAYEMRDKALAPKRAAEDKQAMAALEGQVKGAEATMATLDRPRIERLMALAEAKQCKEGGFPPQ